MTDTLNNLLTKHGSHGTISKPIDGRRGKDSPLERIPPHDNEAEMGILGSILLDSSSFDDVVEIVGASDFYRPAHQKIFQTMEQMVARGEAIDSISLASALKSKGILQQCGERSYIIDLATRSALSKRQLTQFSKIVRGNSKMRQLVQIGVELTALGFDGNLEDIDEIIGDSVSLVTSLALAHQTVAVDVGTVFETLMKEMREGERHYITAPGIDFARIKHGDLVVVSAGTGVGKTALTLNWADEWSKQHNVTYFEYEMPEADLLARLICKHAGVRMEQIQDRDLNAEEVQRIEDAGQELRSRKLKIEEVWCNVGTLMAKIRREAQQGTEIVVIDHLGLIDEGGVPKGMNYAKAVGKKITNPLKRLASELGIVIVLLVQLNREGQDPNRFPRLSHLRDSGEIEQDASIIYMVWSDTKADATTRQTVREDSGILSESECFNGDDFDLIHIGVEKNRNGRTGEKYLLYHGEHFQYEDREESTPLYPMNKEMF